jgi:hypothetical protein
MCGVTVNNPRKYCPLCQGELTGEIVAEKETFPEIPTVYSQYRLFFRLLIFLSIIGGAAALIVNLIFRQTGLWSVIVLAAIFYTWVTLITAVQRRSRISKKILYQVVVLSILLFAIDRANGYKGWAINYVIPAVHVSALLSMAIIAFIRMPDFREYLLHIIIMAVLGLAPLLIVMFGWAGVLWPSLSCTVISVVALVAIIVFGTVETKDELEKRFHV